MNLDPTRDTGGRNFGNLPTPGAGSEHSPRWWSPSAPAWVVAAMMSMFALQWIQVIAAPMALAFFMIALVWPLQRRLEARIPRGLALIASVFPVMGAAAALLALIAYGIGVIRTEFPAYLPVIETTLRSLEAWMEEQGIAISDRIAEQVNPTSILHVVHEAAARANATFGFLALTLIFLVLGLMEFYRLPDRLRRAFGATTAAKLIAAGVDLGWKFRRYALVRGFVSLLTGISTWAFATAIGLDLAVVWGILAFALNFVPFIGSIVAVVPPVLFAVAQAGGWHFSLLVLAGMSLIQFSIGNFLDPRLEGRALAISPFVVVSSIFFWGLIWGIPGALLGVPITIATVAVTSQFASVAWMARLVSYGPVAADDPLER
jgi:AI-2 transport protein TqsA